MKRLRWSTLAVLAWLDIAMYLDTALRWQQGLSFVGGLRWSLWTLPWLGIWLASVAWLTLTGAGFIRHALLAFLAFSWGFFIASSGHPYYDWTSLPFYGGLFVSSNITYWTPDGRDLAVIAAMYHGALGLSVKRPLAVLAPWSVERWAGVVGLACFLVGQTLGFRPIDVTVPVPPPSPLLEALRTRFAEAHVVVGALLVGLSLALGMRRLLWLLRVRRGLVPGYRVEPMPPMDVGRLAKLWPLPTRWLGGVLLRVGPVGAEPVAMLPGSRGSRTSGA